MTIPCFQLQDRVVRAQRSDSLQLRYTEYLTVDGWQRSPEVENKEEVIFACFKGVILTYIFILVEKVMKPKIVKEENDKITLQIQINLNGTMLEMEDCIQQAVNKLGCLATKRAIKKFDTHGEDIFALSGDISWRSKKKLAQTYQTPYGDVLIKRHLYQTDQGNRTFCPMENDAQIDLTSTPKLSKMLSSEFIEQDDTRLRSDQFANLAVTY